MQPKIKAPCDKCGKVFTITYLGKTIFRTCNGCNAKNRVDGTPEGKPAYVLSRKSRIGAKS